MHLISFSFFSFKVCHNILDILIVIINYILVLYIYIIYIYLYNCHYIIIYYALSHILQRRWRITPNILLLLFCCYFFFTGVSQTLTPYCGCSFAITSFSLFIARHACRGVWWCLCCVRVWMCTCRVCILRALPRRVFAALYTILSFLSTSRTLPRRARSIRKFKVEGSKFKVGSFSC